MEQGKDICFMCGTNAKTYVPANNNNNNFNRPVDSAFGSGANFNNNNNAVFGSGASFNNSNYNQMKENYLNSKKDYRNVELKPVKNGERDMFDFFSEHKGTIKIVLFAGLIALLVLIGNAYYKHRIKEIDKDRSIHPIIIKTDLIYPSNHLFLFKYTWGEKVAYLLTKRMTIHFTPDEASTTLYGYCYPTNEYSLLKID